MPAYPQMSFHLETERLTLRPWTQFDAAGVRALHAERGDGTPTIEHVRELIARQLATTEQTGLALLAIRRRDVGDFIGYCGLIVGRSTVEEPEIAFELYKHVHGHGYATERPSLCSMPRS